MIRLVVSRLFHSLVVRSTRSGVCRSIGPANVDRDLICPSTRSMSVSLFDVLYQKRLFFVRNLQNDLKSNVVHDCHQINQSTLNYSRSFVYRTWSHETSDESYFQLSFLSIFVSIRSSRFVENELIMSVHRYRSTSVSNRSIFTWTRIKSRIFSTLANIRTIRRCSVRLLETTNSSSRRQTSLLFRSLSRVSQLIEQRAINIDRRRSKAN